MPKTISKNKRIFIAALTVFLVLTGVMVLGAPNAKADVAEWVLGGLAWIVQGILSIFSTLVALAALLLEAVFKIDKFTDIPVVTAGWEITRGLCNMFFALILLAMAFDTILQTNKFPIKDTLPRLIIVALLINFSLFFGGVIIDFSQIMTHFFIDAAGGPNHNISTQLAHGLSLAKVYSTPTEGMETQGELQKKLSGDAPSLITIIASLVFGIIIILIAAFALAAGAIFMLIRLVTLWVLLIGAPIAWLSMAVPGAPVIGGLAGKWWEKFLQTAFFAPIYAFFIYLAVLAASSGQNIFAGLQSPADEKLLGSVLISSFFSQGIYAILQYIVIIVLLLKGLSSAQSAGLAGASAVIGWGKSLQKGTRSIIGTFAENWAAKGEEKEGKGAWARFRRGTSYLAPTPWKTAWEARQAQKRRESMPVAIGARQDLLNRILPGWEKTDYRERAIRFRDMEERKDILTTSGDEMVQQFDQAEQRSNAPKMGAYAMALAGQNDLNELFRDLQKKFKNLDFSMSAEGMINFVDRILAPKMGQAQANRLGRDLVSILESKGAWIGRPFKYEYNKETKTGQYVKVSNIDPKTKETMKRDDGAPMSVADVARAAATGEWSKMDAQPQVFTTNRFSYYQETYNKETGATMELKLTDDGKRKLATLNADHANRWHQQTKLIVMFKNPNELKSLNEELYRKVLATLAASTKSMTEADLNNYINYNAESVPTATQADKDRLKALLKEEHRRLKKEGEENNRQKT